MVDSPNSGGGILDEFRRYVGDTTYNYVQLELSCDDPSSSVALVEVSDYRLVTTITGGAAAPLDIDLSDPESDTLEKLVGVINANEGYVARIPNDGEGTHYSSDLEIIPPKSILRRFVQLKTRRWADNELRDILNNALVKLGRDIGTTYTVTDVPSSVKDMAFLLGTIGLYWDQINNATKRRGLDLRVEDFRTIHQTALDEYERSLRAYKAVQPVPIVSITPEQLDEMTSGEIIVGTQIRRNLRTGRLTPGSAAAFPAAEQIAATFLGAGKVQLNWTRSRSQSFYRYEVWRGTTAAVDNSSEIALPSGTLPATGVKVVIQPEVSRTMWVDGGSAPLPVGTYYYRLYTYNVNGEWAASEVVSVAVTS